MWETVHYEWAEIDRAWFNIDAETEYTNTRYEQLFGNCV